MRGNMRRVGMSVITAGLLGASGLWLGAQQVMLDKDDIGGTVTGPKGPEAGVWVIAETKDLPTKFARIVVTDDQGRYVVPDLPAAKYEVFVRGFGLVDSPRVAAEPGKTLDLKAVPAPDARAAAAIYPASYWMALLKIPATKVSPSARPFSQEVGAKAPFRSPGELSEIEAVATVKQCMVCHMLGSQVTRTLPPGPGSSLEKWDRRVGYDAHKYEEFTAGKTPQGTPSGLMGDMYGRFGEHRRMFADWTDRIAAGEFPKTAPPRPRGAERNLVITLWDWGTPRTTRTDVAASDERNPRVNVGGRVYGALNPEGLGWLDPATHHVGHTAHGSARSLAIDSQGRPWLNTRKQGTMPKRPAFCDSPTNKFAKYFPSKEGNGSVGFQDPKTQEMTFIETCFGADHNHFDANDVVYYGGAGTKSVIGWIDTKVAVKDPTGEAAQGWCPAVLDTNGDGQITEWTEPNEPIDPKKDHRIEFVCYSPGIGKDGAVWCSASGNNRLSDDYLIRFERGGNPPQTCKTELFRAPKGQNPPLFSAGGSAIDGNGVVWTNWRGSDHLTAFDRRKCKSLKDSQGTGQHCPEGWTIHRQKTAELPGVSFATNADQTYLTQVDKYNTLGLGENVPLVGHVNTNSLGALVPTTGQWVDLYIPYPMGFFSRSANGRIDDPAAGWKGRGLWSSYSITAGGKHMEGGPGTLEKLVKFQMRPNPLAK